MNDKHFQKLMFCEFHHETYLYFHVVILWVMTPCSPIGDYQHLEEHIATMFRVEESQVGIVPGDVYGSCLRACSKFFG
jgi:hypothetical protein